MGVAILNPQDCLKEPSVFPRHVRHYRNPNPIPNSNRPKPNRRIRSTHPSPPPPPPPASVSPVIGQVKILKRGEQLPKIAPPIDIKQNLNKNLDLASTTDLQVLPADIRAGSGGFYAGSAFVTSPPPSSLPLPAFFMKKTNDDATTDLRRMLGLGL